MTPSEKKAGEISLRRLEEVLHNWGRRAIGHTYAMLRGTKADCYFVVLHEAQEKSFMGYGIDRKRIITEDCLPDALKGIDKPVLVDHAVMARWIRGSLDAAERRGFERAKRMAMDAFDKQENEHGHTLYFANKLFDLKYEDSHDEA